MYVQRSEVVDDVVDDDVTSYDHELRVSSSIYWNIRKSSLMSITYTYSEQKNAQILMNI